MKQRSDFPLKIDLTILTCVWCSEVVMCKMKCLAHAIHTPIETDMKRVREATNKITKRTVPHNKLTT